MAIRAERYSQARIVKRPKQALTADEEKQRAEDEKAKRPLEPNRPFETRFTRHHDEAIEASGRIGPFSQLKTTNWPGRTFRQTYDEKVWYRSKTKRRTAPNPFNMLKMHAWTEKSEGTPDYPDVASSGWMSDLIYHYQNPEPMASNKALSRFVDNVRDNCTASAAVTLAEWKQSEKMIVARAGQLTSAIRALKKGNIGRMEQALGINRSKAARDGRLRNGNVRVDAKSGANVWLEYHFGWEPLVKDIYSAVQVLSSKPPYFKVRGRGRVFYPWSQSSGSPTQVPINYTRYDEIVSDSVEIGARVSVENPNMALANQLGLVNPAMVAWELVPFSFLVDWFLPVGNFLNSFTDLLGYKLEYPYTTTKSTVKGTQFFHDWPGVGTHRRTWTGYEGVGLRRVLSIPAYKLRTIPFQGFSCSRGATAIALVIQQFLSLK